MDDSLDEHQRAELLQLMERRERELEEAIARHREAIAAPASDTGSEVRDPVEEGDARMTASIDLAQLQRDEQELLSLRNARDRMRQGGYGRCEECDQPIPFERLKLRPEARFCVRHEEQWEQSHARQAAAPFPS